jgi:CRP/FNR family cyclic AMP-dependent transcriptional regulator
VLRRDAKLELLKRVPLFAQCTKRELVRVAAVADEVDLREGKVLTTEGERGREFFVLVDGTADVRRRGRKVNTMKGGDFFGEVALVADRPRTATVTATSPVHLLVVTDVAFRQLLQRVPSIQAKVMAALAERWPGAS